MQSIQEIQLKKYKVIVFDWDGTLVDSHGAYVEWDKLYLQTFYGVEKPVEYFQDLSSRLKEVTIGNAENRYFRHLDTVYGDGKTPMNEIWDKIYQLAAMIQGEIEYRERAVDVLHLLREVEGVKLAISTNSSMKDLQFFSSSQSKTAPILSPLEFFHYIVTSDELQNIKPHPESYQKIIEHFRVDPAEVLVFEDSLRGVQSAKGAGASVVSIRYEYTERDRDEIIALSDFYIDTWQELLSVFKL